MLMDVMRCRQPHRLYDPQPLHVGLIERRCRILQAQLWYIPTSVSSVALGQELQEEKGKLDDDCFVSSPLVSLASQQEGEFPRWKGACSCSS